MLHYKPYVALPTNTLGRDFAIGDLQGGTEMLVHLLDVVEFDPLKDRLFSTGNMLADEPASLDLLDLFHEPWFHPVLGSGEALLLTELERLDSSAIAFMELRDYLDAVAGSRWGTPHADVQNILMGLPMALETTLADGKRVGLTHAGLPAQFSWARVRKLAERPEVLGDCLGQSLGSGLLWSVHAGLRARFSVSEVAALRMSLKDLEREVRKEACGKPVEDIDLLIAGHVRMPMANPVLLNNRLFLHTGAGEPGGSLTIIQLDDLRCWTALPPTEPIPVMTAPAVLSTRTDKSIRFSFEMLKLCRNELAKV